MKIKLAGLGAGAVGLWLADWLMNPVPISSLLAFIAGATVLLAWPKWPSVYWIAASTTGALIGMAQHRGWHISGRSPQPEEGLLSHLFIEGLVGLAVALACLLVVKMVTRALSSEATGLQP